MPSILITGAGSGIGRALVERAVGRGGKVIAAVRSERDLDSFGANPNLHVVRMDVSSSESVVSAFADADAWLGATKLDVVINCAAVCPSGALEVQDPDVIRDTLNTNAAGSARVLRASLPRLRGHDGRIVLVTSLWGKVAGPMLSAYCSSKFAIEAIADTARRETSGQDVSIILVEPGVVRTRMVSAQVAGAKDATANLPPEHVAQYGSLYRKYAAMIERNSGGGVSADKCAEAIEAAAFSKKPRTRYRVGSDAKAVTTMARVMSDRMLDKMFRLLLK